MQAVSLYRRAALTVRGLWKKRPLPDNASEKVPAPDASEKVPAPDVLPGQSAEKVRLVIWDLDETFWRGTLSEGGIEYLQDNHDTVIELARRGIMSSICSRNDHATIEALLRERGIWDYFVFPSIDWTSKGTRVKKIVEASQLRAPTILFIDDNPMNRAEVGRFVEGIQVADPLNMRPLLEDPLLKGKEDRELSRLAQYKLLERRSKDVAVAEDNVSFLRESGIRVYIEHDIESNIDRAIELINRTNQLNFTKARLPEDQDLARSELRFLLSGMEKQAGLVRVMDRYGDYGFCGFYVQDRSLHDTKTRLVQYCFSCRTLGMEVETWLYRRLGKPELEVRGEVLTDVINSEKVIDWISVEIDDPSKGESLVSAKKIPRIYIRGGCEMVAISHYFELLTSNLVAEFAFQRDDNPVRLDNSEMLRLALEKPTGAALQSLLSLGYQASDFETSILGDGDEECVYILGLWAEANGMTFKHTEFGFKPPVYLSLSLGGRPADLLTFDPAKLPIELKDTWREVALKELQGNFDFEGRLSAEETTRNIMRVVEMLPKKSLVFLIGCTEKTRNDEGILNDFHDHIDLNRALNACAAASDKVVFVGIDDHLKQSSDRIGSHNHYSREVYYRLFSEIRSKIDEWTARNARQVVDLV